MGDEHDNGLDDTNFPTHLDAQTRWIIQRFPDPDIEKLQRSGPTPETSDVPLTLLVTASLQAVGFCADVKGTYTQSEKGLRKEPIIYNPPPGVIPGENDPDILIELLTEMHGLVSGPPTWRRTLLITFKELDFKGRPIAPCVATMCDQTNKGKEILIGVISIETDDLLGGGIGQL